MVCRVNPGVSYGAIGAHSVCRENNRLSKEKNDENYKNYGNFGLGFGPAGLLGWHQRGKKALG
jgi:hypothetical protein